MKPLSDHVLLYDQVCPLCKGYSCAFVKMGLLEETGRAPYQQKDNEITRHVDLRRATDEIALVNRTTGEVTYGARSLMVILQHWMPGFGRLFRQRWFVRAADAAYHFVSYNRRVMMPARDGYAHQPSFSLPHRLAYLLITWVITATFLHRYTELLVPLIPPSSYTREFLICGGQMVWQAAFMLILKPERTWDYLGNLMTISFVGGIALALIQLAGGWYHNPLLFGGLFACVAGLMFLEHIRRTHILQISGWLSVTWVLYRVVLLGMILWLR